MTTNIELRYKLLTEAMSILPAADLDAILEAAARDERKDTVKSLRELKSGEVYSAFCKGKLSEEEGKKVYQETMKSIESLEKKVEQIPAETTMEEIASFFRMDFEGSAYAKELIAGFAIGAVASAVAFLGITTSNLGLVLAADAASYVGSWAAKIALFNKYRTTKSGEKNWNKAYAERKVAKIKKKVTAAYAKHYAGNSTIQEACEMLEILSMYTEDDDIA